MGVGALIEEPRPMSLDLQKSWILRLSNEVYNFSVAQVALERTGTKVERSKKRLDLHSKS